MIPRIPIIIPEGGIQNISRFMPSIPDEQSDDVKGITYLGTPIYSNLRFLANPNTPENKDLVFDTVLFQVDVPNNVVMTQLSGRNGSVKEYINRADYEITIQGLIVSPYPLVFPKDDVVAFNNLLNLPTSLEVASDFLQCYSIHNIVSLRCRFDEVPGSRNQVAFTMQAVSDEPIELREL